MPVGDLSWKVGDLGRFSVEDPKRPRFEVLGSKPNRGIAIWYGGSNRPVFVPVDTFKERCVNHWTIEVVPQLPSWVVPKAAFTIENERAAKLTQAVVRAGYSQQISQVDVKGHDLRIRQIRLDYASCFDEVSQILVMVPLKIIVNFANQSLSKWDRLTGDDVFGDDLDEIDELLKGAV